MNKKVLILTLSFLILGILSFLSYKIVVKIEEKNTITNSIKIIPEFSFTTLSNTVFTNDYLKPNMSTVFLYFNSECDFCQHEAENISESVNKFKDIQLIFVSTEPIEKIKIFSEQYNLYNQSNITFLYDDSDIFSTQFDAQSIPYILIYNKKNELIKKHNGQLNANGILRAINQ